MTMKKLMSNTWLGMLCLSGILTVPLQNAFAQSDQDLIEVARSALSTDRKAAVAGALELTDSEANVFWPLYRDYRSAMEKISDDRVKLILDYARLYPAVPEEQA